MQQKHLKRKGLTLLEVIISIAVYAVLALLLAEIMTLVNSTIRSTEQLNNRLSYEAKYADNLMTGDDDHEFDNKKVGVEIQYDVQKVNRSNGQVTSVESNHTLKQFNGDDLKADEYTADYNETSPGTHYHDNTNYRFMRFDKTNLDKSKAADVFVIRLWLDVPASVMNDLKKVVVNGNYGGGKTSDSYVPSEFRPDGNDWYYLDLPMDSSATKDADGNSIEATIQDTINIVFYRGTTIGENSGKTINLTADQKYDEITVTYPLSQKQGSATNYYEGYNIIYRNGSVAVPTELTQSELSTHGIPKEMKIHY